MSGHQMEYRAGVAGFEAFGIPAREPGWSCTCGEWSFPARWVPSSRTGNNAAEAARAHEKHRLCAVHGEET